MGRVEGQVVTSQVTTSDFPTRVFTILPYWGTVSTRRGKLRRVQNNPPYLCCLDICKTDVLLYVLAIPALGKDHFRVCWRGVRVQFKPLLGQNNELTQVRFGIAALAITEALKRHHSEELYK